MNPTVKQLADSLLQNWNETENGEGLFKFTGGYWEVLHPILKKYAPKQLAEYEKAAGETFDYFNEEVKKSLATGDEETDIKNAIDYLNGRLEQYATANDVHIIDLGDDNIIPYMPNQDIDPSDYFGRENE